MIKKFFGGKIYPFIIMIIVFTFWFISYLSIKEKIDPNLLNKIEWISLISIGLIALVTLIIFDDSKASVPILMYMPFIFAHPFYANEMPRPLIFGIILMLLGLILHLIIHHKPFKLGKNFIGLFLIVIAMALGGINLKTDYSKTQFISCLVMGLGVLFLYYVFSLNKYEFDKVANIVNGLGLLLVLQTLSYYILSDDIIDSIFSKSVNVGWGITNNIGLMLLLTMPFALYGVTTNKGIRVIISVTLFVSEFMITLFTYSRGAIASMAIGTLVLIPCCFFITKKKLIYSLTVLFIIGVTISYLRYLRFNHDELYQRFITYLSKVDLDDLNGRTPIYDAIISLYKANPIFGQGMFAPFYGIIDVGVGEYQWAHSTIYHTALTMGNIGLIALFYHFGEKYFYLIKRFNKDKFLVMIAFLMSGLYGLFDVSYYFINYMLTLIIILAIIDSLLRKQVEIKDEVS